MPQAVDGTDLKTGNAPLFIRRYSTLLKICAMLIILCIILRT